MKKYLFSVLFVLIFVSSVFAQPTEEVEKQIKTLFPNFSISTVTESPVPGLYEVVSKDGNIVYWSPKGYMIFGEIWTSTGKSITAERRQEIVAEKFKNLDLSDAVKIGNGKNKVITFTDPDCPFCRKSYEFLSKRNDITEYLFLLPFHGDSSKKKIAYLLCSKDKKQAYSEIMSGREVSVSNECIKKSEETFKKHLSVAQSMGIGGTPTFYINGKLVQGANIPLIENILNGGK
ncbi:DsbC family protein [Thermodesulfovibrio sp. 1176]|uniref:DsbC family protein n=1 Tax=Thermodesulfovibrio sp. 1176 TaxID=3043424 RepID=UPI0024822CB5|nr:DsbC family protein [Thermodesulfovibrio sp. 1176]MDI1472931.1 DsbC family protein [Thermodesulfovibrio sp. 1176]